jgi:uncharacterized membrane protein
MAKLQSRAMKMVGWSREAVGKMVVRLRRPQQALLVAVVAVAVLSVVCLRRPQQALLVAVVAVAVLSVVCLRRSRLTVPVLWVPALQRRIQAALQP